MNKCIQTQALIKIVCHTLLETSENYVLHSRVKSFTPNRKSVNCGSIRRRKMKWNSLTMIFVTFNGWERLYRIIHVSSSMCLENCCSKHENVCTASVYMIHSLATLTGNRDFFWEGISNSHTWERSESKYENKIRNATPPMFVEHVKCICVRNQTINIQSFPLLILWPLYGSIHISLCMAVRAHACLYYYYFFGMWVYHLISSHLISSSFEPIFHYIIL